MLGMLNGYGVPYSYDINNTYNSILSPSTMHATDTGLSAFFQRYLIQRAMAVPKFTMPDEWAENYFLFTLFYLGYVIVIRTDKYGVIPQHGTLGGYNVMYQPNYAIVSNPLLKGSGTRKLIIGRDCEIIKLQPTYLGIWDIVSYYADNMANTAAAAAVNTLGSKLSYLFAAKNKTAAESFKKALDKILSGEPAVVVDKDLFDEEGPKEFVNFTNKLSDNFITPELMECLRKWERMFDAAVGIPTTNNEKKERVTSYEINGNNMESCIMTDMWMDDMKKQCEKVSELFGIKLSVDWRVRPDMEGGVGNGVPTVNNEPNGTV